MSNPPDPRTDADVEPDLADASVEPDPDGADAGWRRLSIRIVYLDVARLVGSAALGGLGLALDDSAAVRPLLFGAAFGALAALADFARWLTTSYRVTADRVEMRSGRLVRVHRTVPRDRIRTLDSSAMLRHRLFSLRVLHIGSGEQGSSFTLDALPVEAVTRLQRELGREPAAPDVQGTAVSGTAAPGTVIARVRPSWVAFNAVTLGSVFFVIGPLGAAYGALRPFGVDLFDVGRDLFDRLPVDGPWAVALCVAVALPFGVAGQAAGFALKYWGYTLTRVGTSPTTSLVTRSGLINTRTVHQDEIRLRGLTLSEPLVWRRLRLARTTVLATGLSTADVAGNGSAARSDLPQIRREEALEIAARILPDGDRPLEAPLTRHPRGALVAELLDAITTPVSLAVLLLVLGRTGAIPEGWWPAGPALLPLTLGFAVADYRSRGHAVAGRYVVVRSGVLNRVTVAVQHRAVVGLSFEQTTFQRRGGRMTVTFATAAGTYKARDVGFGQGIALMRAVRPDLAGTVVADDDRQVRDLGSLKSSRP